MSDFSQRCWQILENYWILPLPEGYTHPTHAGFCVVCGTWTTKLDQEAMILCPQRWLLPHREILPFVVAELKKLKGDREDWLSLAQIKEASKRGRDLFDRIES